MNFKKHAKVLGLLYLVAMLLTLPPLGTTAYAADAYDPLEVEIPYKHVYTTTDATVDSVFHYIITAKDNAPLPAEASATGSFSFNGVSGTGTKDGDNTVFDLTGTLTFTFTKPGVYVYELRADLATDSKKLNAGRYTFEPRVTTISLYIANAPGDGMKLQMLTAEDDKNVKPNEIEFDPVYKGPVKQEPTKPNVPNTGDNSPIWQYAALIAVSGTVIVVLLATGKRKGREEDA